MPIRKIIFRQSLVVALALILLTACNSKVATVNGTLCYPSEYLPKMNVYLKEAKSNKVYKVITQENQQAFKFKSIPFGDYYAYAYTIEDLTIDSNGKKAKASGGFTQAVPCGLNVNCTDHSLIPIKLRSKTNKEVIKICDWYGAKVPSEK